MTPGERGTARCRESSPRIMRGPGWWPGDETREHQPLTAAGIADSPRAAVRKSPLPGRRKAAASCPASAGAREGKDRLDGSGPGSDFHRAFADFNSMRCSTLIRIKTDEKRQACWTYDLALTVASALVVACPLTSPPAHVTHCPFLTSPALFKAPARNLTGA
jgi:hypothetical protein